MQRFQGKGRGLCYKHAATCQYQPFWHEEPGRLMMLKQHDLIVRQNAQG